MYATVLTFVGSKGWVRRNRHQMEKKKHLFFDKEGLSLKSPWQLQDIYKEDPGGTCPGDTLFGT
jgi:hypothetical protein